MVDIVVMAVMARLLEPNDYGIFAAALLFIAVCDLLREIGVGVTLIQLPSVSERDQRTALTLSLLMACMVFAVSQLGAGAFAGFMRMPELENVIRVLAIMVLMQSFAVVSQGLLLRNLRIMHVTTAEVLSRATASLAVGVGLALAGFGYWALVAASLTEAMLRTIALVVIARPSFRPLIDRTSARRLLGRGSGFAVSRAMDFVSQRADLTVVGRYADAASLGIYSRAHKLMHMPTNLYKKVADRAVFPALAKVQGQPERLCSAYLRGLELTALIGISLSGLLFVLAPQIIDVLLGEKWQAVIPIFSVLALGTYFRLAGQVSVSVLRATASMRHLIINQAVYALLMAVGSVYAVRFGLPAVAWATAIATIVWFGLVTAQACIVAKVTAAALLRSQVHGILLAVTVTGCAELVSLGLSLVGANSWIVLLGTGATIAIIGLMIVWFRPRILLGTEGSVMATQVRTVILRKLRLG